MGVCIGAGLRIETAGWGRLRLGGNPSTDAPRSPISFRLVAWTLMDAAGQGDLRIGFPIFQPQDLSVLTTFGVTAAVNGMRTKKKLLWMAYARASCVAKPASN